MAALVWRDCLRFVAGFVLILAARFGLASLVSMQYFILASGPLYDLFLFFVIYWGCCCGWFGLG